MSSEEKYSSLGGNLIGVIANAMSNPLCSGLSAKDHLNRMLAAVHKTLVEVTRRRVGGDILSVLFGRAPRMGTAVN
jgi:hypothetical protein